MNTGFFDQYALYWISGLILIYTVAHLLIYKHPRFQSLLEVQKKIAVKLVAISAFTAVYMFVKLLGA